MIEKSIRKNETISFRKSDKNYKSNKTNKSNKSDNSDKSIRNANANANKKKGYFFHKQNVNKIISNQSGDNISSSSNNLSESIIDIQNEIKTLQQDKILLNNVKNSLKEYIKELDEKTCNS
jgi:hypothetical protein